MPVGTVLSFPPFHLDPANEQLWKGDQLIPLRPKPSAILRYLVARPGQLVTKEELLKAIWPGTRVLEELLNTYIRDLRKVLGDDPEAPRFIDTVVRRGYRFIAPVTTSIPPVTDFRRQEPSASSQPSPDSPSPLATVVGRERELDQLHRWFEKALRGERQVVFVTGEPGVGKTTLVEAFLQRIATAGTIWIERGQCVEQYGPGEAYLPVLEALGRSCRRPGAERTIDLLRRYAPTWLVQMSSLLPDAEFEVLQRKVHGATRERMLREMAEALEVMTAKQCSVVVLEDLQWSDHSTLDLLSYVAQRREPACLLVIGTYRPTDVILSGHPVNTIKQDLQGRRLCEELPLGSLPKEAISQYLALRFPQNQFSDELSQFLYRSTDGNPLFMVNVADYLESRGLVNETNGHWQLQAKLDDISLEVPESLRQMIERQVGRLTKEEQRLLEIASVVGAEFSGATVAAGLGEEVERIEGWCEALVSRGQFLRSIGVEALPDGTVAGRYGFAHALYQDVLYQHLPATQRIRLHRRIGEYLERASGSRAGEISTELAMHFERGQDYPRTVRYLGIAAQNAMQRSAHKEAITHLTKGLEWLGQLPEGLEHKQHELRLQILLGAAHMALKGYAAPEVGNAYSRAQVLCQQLGTDEQLYPVLFGLWQFYTVRGELKTARGLAEQLLILAQRVPDSSLRLLASRSMGVTSYCQGEFVLAREYLEQSIALYDRHQHHSLVFLHGGAEPKVHCLSWLALSLWNLGYQNQALTRIQEALALAKDLSHSYSEAFVYDFAAIVHQFRREKQHVQEQAEAAIHLSIDLGFLDLQAIGAILRGWALTEPGGSNEEAVQLGQGLSAWQAAGAELAQPYWLALQAEVYRKLEMPENGLNAIGEAIDTEHKTGERNYEAELYRLKGELRLAQEGKEESLKTKGKRRKKLSMVSPQSLTPHTQEAEECFLKAIEIARKQSAKSLELRAAVSLGRLWQQQGKKKDAHKMLSDIYGWFTEGFDTKDLQEARALLAELS